MKKIGFLFIVFMALSVNLSSAFAQIDWDRVISNSGKYPTVSEKYTTNSGEYLDLSIQHPKLTKIPSYVFNMTNLRELDVSGNRIGIITRDILKLTNLEILNLGGNLYLKELPDFLMNMESLKTIYFEGMRTWSQAKQDEAVRRFAQKGINVILRRQYSPVTDQE